MSGKDDGKEQATAEQCRQWLRDKKESSVWCKYIEEKSNLVMNIDFRNLDIGTRESLIAYTQGRIFNEFNEGMERYLEIYKIRSPKELTSAIIEKYPYSYIRNRIRSGFKKLKPIRDNLMEKNKKKNSKYDEIKEISSDFVDIDNSQEFDINEIDENKSLWSDEDIGKLENLLSEFELAKHIYCAQLIKKYFLWSLVSDARDFDDKKQYYHEYKGPHQSIFERVNGENPGSVGKCMEQFREFVINNLKIARI